MKYIDYLRLGLVCAWSVVCTGSAARAETCAPIVYLRTTTNSGTWDFKTDKTYNQSVLQYKGGKSPWSVNVVSGSLPPGMSLKVVPFTGGYALDGYSGDVFLTGQPTAEGDFVPRVQLTDSCTNGTQSSEKVLLVLKPRCGALKFPDGLKPPSALLGKPYSFQLKTVCDLKYMAQEFSANQSTLPPGLVISASGLLSGTPTKVGTYNATIIATTYGAAFQTTDRRFPVQVIDNVPPALTFFDVATRAIGSQGGKTDVVVKASDNGALKLPEITVTAPNGSQTHYVAGLKSGTYGNGEFVASISLPANTTAADIVYKVSGAVQDTEGNTVVCPTRTIAVNKAPTRIPVGSIDSADKRLNIKPAVNLPPPRIPAK